MAKELCNKAYNIICELEDICYNNDYVIDKLEELNVILETLEEKVLDKRDFL